METPTLSTPGLRQGGRGDKPAWPESPDKEDDQQEASDHESTVGGINFTSGAVPKHDDMGFTPYFNKNCRKLRGPYPSHNL
jgi:hypothetical protein